jgi:DNA N-6-adenine-methyltransferase (Dam)
MIPLSTASKQDWRTPRYVYEYACLRWGDRLIDMASDGTDSLCPRCVVGADPSAPPPVEQWLARWWCNPPWRYTARWVSRALWAAGMGRAGVLLLRADPSTRYFAELATRGRIVLLTPRVAYGGADGRSPPCGSMLVSIGDTAGIELVRLDPPCEATP